MSELRKAVGRACEKIAEQYEIRGRAGADTLVEIIMDEIERGSTVVLSDSTPMANDTYRRVMRDLPQESTEKAVNK